MKKTTLILSALAVVAMAACGDNTNNNHGDHADSIPSTIYDAPADVTTPNDTMPIDSVNDSLPPRPTANQTPLN